MKCIEKRVGTILESLGVFIKKEELKNKKNFCD